MTLLPALSLSFFAAAALSYALTPLAGWMAVRLGALDMPGGRKIHARPIPRLGGLAVVTAVFVVSPIWLWWAAPWPVLSGKLLMGIGLGVLPVVGVSIVDDIRTLRAGPKFLAHLVGAAIAVWFGVSLGANVHLFGYTISVGPLAFPLSVLWIVGLTNAFNIVDGLDGLSAGLALISAMSLSGIFVLAGHAGMAGETLVLAGALVGFLPYNMYPARMFLGDTGAAAIGFCLATYALKGGATLSSGFATLLPVFVLGLPIAETLISVARRLMVRFERSDAGGVFEADRNHMHHRLLALGIDHPRAVQILYTAGLMMAAAALASMFMTAHDSALLVLAMLLAGVLGVRRLGYDEFAVVRNGTMLRVYEAPALRRSMFVVFVDLILVLMSASAAVALKTDDWSLASHFRLALEMAALLAPITAIVFWRMGLYLGTWSLAGAEDFARACSAVLVATLFAYPVRLFISPADTSPALFLIYALIGMVLVASTRGSYLLLAATHRRTSRHGAPALIYGAGRKGVTALQQLAANAAALHPVGFIDDDPAKQGKLVHGMPVVGSSGSLERVIRRLGVRAVVVASDAIEETRISSLRSVCEQAGISMLRMQISFDHCVSVATEPRMAMALAPAAPARAAEISHVSREIRRAVARPAAAPTAAAVIECPACRSSSVRRSHVSSATERVRKRLSQKRLFRCEACGWRGWRDVNPTAVFQLTPIVAQRGGTWDSIDAIFTATPSSKLAS